jgi:hypothetical protein
LGFIGVADNDFKNKAEEVYNSDTGPECILEEMGGKVSHNEQGRIDDDKEIVRDIHPWLYFVDN